MSNKIENIGMQPIHIRFSTNINNDKQTQILTKSMIYTPPKKDEDEDEDEDDDDNKKKKNETITEYPLFTDNIKLPINTILKLPKKFQKDLFFNPLAFKKLIGNKIENDIEVRNRNATNNLIILLSILFPISFPIKSNIRETFSENIKETVININANEDEALFSMLTDIFDQTENDYGYCDFNEPYTVTKITLINDIINDPIFSELIQNSINFQNFRSEKMKKYKKTSKEIRTIIENTINKNLSNIQNEFKNTNSDVYGSYKRIISKTSNINRDAKHPPSLMEPMLNSLIKEDKSNIDSIINTFVKLYELKQASTDLNYIPFTFTKLDGFSKLLNDSYNYYIQIETLKAISNLNIANNFFQKEKENPKSLNSVEKTIITTLKSYNIFDSFLQLIQKYKSPNRSYTNENLSKILDNSETNMDEYINLIDYINKINKEERPSDELLNNDNMKDNLQTGVMYVIETIQDNNNSKDKKEIQPLNKKSNKYYDVMINFELIKGVLTDENMSEIKCPYKNDFLIALYDKLKYAEDRNPILFYNNFNVFDLNKYIEKKKQEGGFPANITTIKKEGKKTRKRKKTRFNKSIRIANSFNKLYSY